METELEVLRIEMKKHINMPKRSMLNSESSHIRYSLHKNGYYHLSERYWNWACSYNLSDEFPDDIKELQIKLNQIDSQQTIPEWGTSGT
jgi:hypothetical protein